jgi:hypothetical protein
LPIPTFKKMKTKSIFLLLVFFLAISCNKNELGGKSTITGTVIHHSKAIPNATIFIKFNAKDFPGKDSTLYDEKVRCDADGVFTVKCYKGDYFLYARGMDLSILPPTVSGGINVNIRNNETVNADIAVTED